MSRAARLAALALVLAAIASGVLAQTGAAAQRCAAAPASRLRVGMTAVVSPEVGRVNLRALPAVDTGIEAPLYSGSRLTVLAGPSCNGRYRWWRVETTRGLRGWAAEGSWERYYLLPAADADAQPARPLPQPLDVSCPPGRPAPRPCPLP